MNKKYNYREIQKFLDSGATWRDARDEFGINMATICKARKRGDLITRNQSQAIILHNKKNPPRKLSQETKDKISVARKKFLAENPDKVPYLLNHSSKNSYPEEYFNEVFKQANLNVIRYHRVKNFELDFALLDKKIDIEIDGEQHYVDKRIVKHDIKRTKTLNELGWATKRIRWSEYQKLSFDEKKNFVDKFINSFASVAQ